MSDLEFSVKDGIATARLNRPAKKNALSEEMVGELARALREALDDPVVRVLIITGAGNAFCSGGDLGRRAKESEGTTPTPLQPARRAFPKHISASACSPAMAAAISYRGLSALRARWGCYGPAISSKPTKRIASGS